MTCAQDGSLLVHEIDEALEDFADKSRESMSDLEANYGFEEENQGAGMKKLKSKLRLTWEDAAIAGQIENEKVKKQLLFFL